MVKKWLRQNRDIILASIILAAIFIIILYYQAAPKTLPPPLALATPSQDIASPNTPTINIPQLDKPIPLIYSHTLEEKQIQQYLKKGAVILPLGTSLGEPGNVVITAHSSGTASFGPYRFAFTKLGELEVGEEFQITAGTATYTYRVYAKEIVWPSQVDRLPDDDRSTVTLVTCWPPWTNLKRLLVHSELLGAN